MRIAERFRDPLDVVAPYLFAVNHEGEEGNEQQRNVENTAPVSGVGFVMQQGAKSPQTFRYSGRILTKNQLDRMQEFYDLCDGQTIFFRDFTGVEYEVTITAFTPVRERCAWNARDPVNAPFHTWKYTLAMQVHA